jgi:hypothetical protein
MAYVTPGTVAAGDVATAAAWNVVVNSIIASPRGVLGKQKLNTAFGTSATHTVMQDTGLAVSVTYENSRVIKVSCGSQYYPNGGLQSIGANILRGATLISSHFFASASLDAAVSNHFLIESYFVTTSATTETIKVQIAAGTLNSQVSQFADASFSRFLIVEDIGPS